MVGRRIPTPSRQECEVTQASTQPITGNALLTKHTGSSDQCLKGTGTRAGARGWCGEQNTNTNPRTCSHTPQGCSWCAHDHAHMGVTPTGTTMTRRREAPRGVERLGVPNLPSKCLLSLGWKTSQVVIQSIESNRQTGVNMGHRAIPKASSRKPIQTYPDGSQDSRSLPHPGVGKSWDRRTRQAWHALTQEPWTVNWSPSDLSLATRWCYLQEAFWASIDRGDTPSSIKCLNGELRAMEQSLFASPASRAQARMQPKEQKKSSRTLSTVTVSDLLMGAH